MANSTPSANPLAPSCWGQLLANQPLLPVITATNSQEVIQQVRGLAAAGFGQIEITLRQAASWQLLPQLSDLAKELNLTLIAGSINSPEQLAQLAKLNINWVVSPGWLPSLGAEANNLGMHYLPGIATPSEAMQAAEAGCHQLKFFPAASLGTGYLANLAAALPQLSFVPTGGINSTNLANWLALPSVLAVGGSWLLAASANQAAFIQQAKTALASAKHLKEA